MMSKEETVKIYKNEASSIADASNSARYIVIGESTSAHCCFEYTVVDTKGGKTTCGDYWEEKMCETFEEQDAVEICTALNERWQKKK